VSHNEVILNRQCFAGLDVFVGSCYEQVVAECKKSARLEAKHIWIPWRIKQEKTTQSALDIMTERLNTDVAAIQVAKADFKTSRDELKRGRAAKAAALTQGAPLRLVASCERSRPSTPRAHQRRNELRRSKTGVHVPDPHGGRVVLRLRTDVE